MDFDRRSWGLLDVLDAFASGERSPHVWAGARELANVIRREARGPFGKQRLEQTLTSTQREELGALLRYACYRTMRMNPHTRRGDLPARNADGSLWKDDADMWHAREIAASSWDDRGQEKQIALIHRSRETRWSGEPAAAELALAALRLDENPVCRFYLAHLHTSEGQAERALAIIEGLLSRASDGRLVQRLLLARGFALAGVLRLHEALECYREASDANTTGPAAPLGLLTVAMRLGIRDEFTVAGWRLGECGLESEELGKLLKTWYADLGEEAKVQIRSDQVKRWSDGLPGVTQSALQEILP